MREQCSKYLEKEYEIDTCLNFYQYYYENPLSDNRLAGRHNVHFHHLVLPKNQSARCRHSKRRIATSR